MINELLIVLSSSRLFLLQYSINNVGMCFYLTLSLPLSDIISDRVHVRLCIVRYSTVGAWAYNMQCHEFLNIIVN